MRHPGLGIAVLDLFDHEDVFSRACKKIAGHNTTPKGEPVVSPRVFCRSFIGRERELAKLRAVYRALLGGEGGLVLVTGSAGIGKSRLIEELHKSLQTDAPWFVTGNCVEFLRSPYMPIREILEEFSLRPHEDPKASRPGDSLSSRLLRVGEQIYDAEQFTPGEFDQREKFRKFREVLDAFRSLSKVRPIIAVLEDIHFSDVGTCELLEFLAPRIRESRALFVITYRPESIPEWSPLLPIVLQLERQAIEHIGVGPFSDSELRLFIQKSISGSNQLSFEALRYVEELAEGNPFWAGELLRTVVQQYNGLLEKASNLPPSLSATILERFERLSPEDASIIEHAAVIGRRFEAGILARIVDKPLSSVISALRRGRDLSLLEELETRPPSYAFHHAIAREIIYKKLLAVETLELHAKIARELEAMPPDHNRTVELAYHWAATRNTEKAIFYNEAAAQEAVAVWAFADAARFYERTLNFVVEAGKRRAQLCERLAYALYICGRGGEARHWFEVAIEEYTSLGDSEEVAQMLLHLARQRWLFGNTSESLELAIRASRVVSQEACPQYFVAEVTVARYLAMLGESEDALRHLIIADESTCERNPALSAAFHDVRAVAEANLGNVQEAIADFETATRLAELSGDTETTILAWNNFGYLASWLGREEVAIRCYERALAISEDHGHTMRMAFVALSYARTLARFGKLHEAKKRIDAALTLDVDAPIVKFLLAEVAIPVGLMLEEPTMVARAADEQVLRTMLESRESERLGPLLNAFIELAESKGDSQRARALLDLSLRSLTTADQSWWLLTKVPLYADKGDVIRARALLARAAKLRQHLAARACLSLLEARNSSRNAQTSKAVIYGQKAARLFNRLGWPNYRAQALEAAGEITEPLKIYREIGNTRDANRLEHRARRSSAIRGKVGTVLTKRELEIARLVAQGNTNREIASSLSISEHTVIHHLESAYNRLGIHSRSQLTAIVVSKLQAS
jgi:DNA-binding CsgD family transcriptional regulator